MLINFGKRPIVLDFRARVYFKNTHSYLWIRDGRNYGYFLTLESGSIDLVKVKRSEDGSYGIMGWNLRPEPNKDFIKAIRVYHNSTLLKTPVAIQEISIILGLSPRPVKEESAIKTDIGKPISKPKAEKIILPKGDTYTLAHICQELKLEPAEARRRLRNQKIEKPSSSWSWPNKMAAESVIRALTA